MKVRNKSGDTSDLTFQQSGHTYGSNNHEARLQGDLSQFEIYRCPETNETHEFELTSLHHPYEKRVSLRFDGCIPQGIFTHKVGDRPVRGLCVERLYESHGPSIGFYLQSDLGVGDELIDVESRMRKPFDTYERFHKPFSWIATLAEYIADYISSSCASKELYDFHVLLAGGCRMRSVSVAQSIDNAVKPTIESNSGLP